MKAAVKELTSVVQLVSLAIAPKEKMKAQLKVGN
jgi:hypothetical protein